MSIATGQWRLSRIELVNWGTFAGHTVIDVARRGHLFTGPSGSGKSSLLDGIATVLTPRVWVRYNAAAQDQSARADDRSLVSYIRGAWAKQADELEDRAVSTYLRTGATWSGLLLRFEDGATDPVTLVRLFHLRGGGADAADVRDVGFIDRSSPDLLAFESFATSGLDARGIKRAFPDALVTTSGAHKTYFSRLTRLLGIGSTGALQLLHKTQSAKNLGSLDRLFREFMLDQPRTFERAKEAVAQFQDLNEAHKLVVRAREQVEQLRDLEPSATAYESAARDLDEARRLQALLPTFQTRLLLQETRSGRDTTRVALAAAQSAELAASERRDAADASFAAADAAVRDVGGDHADRARERLDDAKRHVAEVSARAGRTAEALRAVDVDVPTDAESYAALRDAAERELAESADDPRLHEHDANRAYIEARNEVRRLDEEILELRRRPTNIPANLLRARTLIAEKLRMNESVLPFAGELMDVRPEHVAWTGAIERVLRPLSTTLVVRADLLPAVRRTADALSLGARVVFEAVPASADDPRRVESETSLVYRVRVADGPFHTWLNGRLAEQYDYACVDSPDDLDGVPRGVTIRGQVKTSARRYVKDDRFRVDDREQWVMGTDNEAKVDELVARRQRAEADQHEADALLQRAQQEQARIVRRREVLLAVLRQPWHELDLASANHQVDERARELRALTDGNAQLSDAVARADTARQARDNARDAAAEAIARVRQLEAELVSLRADEVRLRDELTALPPLDTSDAQILAARFQGVQRQINRTNVSAIGFTVQASLRAQADEASITLARSRSEFERRARDFVGMFSETAARVEPSIDDRSGFAALRAEIESVGLPQHEAAFFRLLREKSRDAVGLLLDDLRSAPKEVRDRIDPVNQSLSRSPFDRDRTLSIRVRDNRSAEVNTFIAELRSIVDGSWDRNEAETAEARFAVLADVMNRLASSERDHVQWRARCLDTREHVTFQARELNATGDVVAVHDSSAGLSGGQRQKLVIFCLAAALRYQLTQDEADLPRYGTIVLDEAFDKADSAYTRMAMDIFEEFGFHMILATPQKLLTTLEPYVGAVTAISNPTRAESRVAHVAWHDGDGPTART
ncbi:ATP-binding protein [Microbacterium sp. ZW T5_56]|uniref:ATP-binding protein n=1 Tax=Microbacterium sp. ZW T5_56 TaxID=3378081 RepID=UPI00385347A0